MLTEIIKIWFRHKCRNRDLLRSLVIITLFLLWLLMCYFSQKKEIDTFFTLLHRVDISSLALLFLPTFALSDCIVKFFFKKEVTKVPDYIKTKPIQLKQWNLFGIVYNIFNIWNIYFLIPFVPFLYSYCDSFKATIILITLYLISLLNSILFSSIRKVKSIGHKLVGVASLGIYILLLYFCSDIKDYNFTILYGSICTCLAVIICVAYYFYSRISNYNDIANTVSSRKDTSSISLLKMEYISIMRSKRIMQMLLMSIAIVLFCAYRFAFDESGVRIMGVTIPQMMTYFAISMASFTLGQYILGIEANYFCGIWTKPYPFEILLDNKYRFFALATIANSLLLIPLVFISTVTVLEIVSMSLFIAGFANIFLFFVLFFVKRLDLKSSSFYNYQGFAFIPTVIEFATLFLSMKLYFFILSSLDEWIACIILSLIGIITYLLRRFVFKFINLLFNKYRYDIIERFRTS